MPIGHTFAMSTRHLLLLLLLASFASPLAAQSLPAGPCYFIADNDNLGIHDGFTYRMPTMMEEMAVGLTGTDLIEAAALDIGSGVLYAADGGRLGRIDLNTGLFTEIGAFGRGDGALGEKGFNDVDGLTFAPDGTLYGVERRLTEDLLFQIDHTTGAARIDAFGDNIDYLVIQTNDSRHDIDDLAFAPSGLLYAVQGVSGERSHLVTIDPTSGTTNDLGPLDTDNIEGLSFDAVGTLFGSQGSDGNRLVGIDMVTATTTALADLGTEGYRDYEALDCSAAGINTITGSTFRDDGTGNPFAESLGGAELTLYHDTNRDGIRDAGDVPVATATTGIDGLYTFRVPARGPFLVHVDPTSLPGDTPLSSTNDSRVTFNGFGQTATINFGVDATQYRSNQTCYVITGSNDFGSSDILSRIDWNEDLELIVGQTDRSNFSAVAFNPWQGSLYATDGATLGRLDPVTGSFERIGVIAGGNGTRGTLAFNNVNGLAFDAFTGALYGISATTSGDVLFRLNTETGNVIPRAFSTGDYVPLVLQEGSAPLTDLVIDPVSGDMLALLPGDASTPDARPRVLQLDIATGATTERAAFDLPNLTGISFDASGILLGVLGGEENAVVLLDPATGNATRVAPLGRAGYSAYNAIDCLTDTPNTLTLTVFADANGNGVRDPGEVGQPDVTVTLYRDDRGEPSQFLTTTRTDASGLASIAIAAEGTFWVAAQADGLPPGYNFTTDQQAPVTTNGFGQSIPIGSVGVRGPVNTSQAAADDLPETLTLLPNYPNPFNPTTSITFALPQNSTVQLTVHDLLGREVAVLTDAVWSAGAHTVRFDAAHLPSGTYLYRLTTPQGIRHQTMVLLR